MEAGALTKIERAYVAGATTGRDEYDRQEDADPTIALDLTARFPEIDQRRTFRKLRGLPSRGPLARKAVPVSEDALLREVFGLLD